jgi:hypothetical protein
MDFKLLRTAMATSWRDYLESKSSSQTPSFCKKRGRRPRSQNPEAMAFGKEFDARFQKLGGHAGKRVFNKALKSINSSREKKFQYAVSRSTARHWHKAYLATKQK